jgi:hypothetical protein
MFEEDEATVLVILAGLQHPSSPRGPDHAPGGNRNVQAGMFLLAGSATGLAAGDVARVVQRPVAGDGGAGFEGWGPRGASLDGRGERQGRGELDRIGDQIGAEHGPNPLIPALGAVQGGHQIADAAVLSPEPGDLPLQAGDPRRGGDDGKVEGSA